MEAWVYLGIAVMVCCLCPRLYVAMAVVPNTTVHNKFWAWDLQSSTRPLRCCVCKVPQSVVVATQSSRRPSELRVVCDTMLTGLGRQLRCCGVDVRLIDADASHDTAAKVTLGHLCLSLVCDKPLFIKTAQYIVLLPQMHDILGLFVWCWAVDYSVAWYWSLGGTVL